MSLDTAGCGANSLSASTTIRVNIKTSKTDPFRRGTLIHIGRSIYPLCAIEALVPFKPYVATCGNGLDPLFLLQCGQTLSRQLLTSWLRQIPATAGVLSSFSSHSFRIGASTVPFQCE